MTGPKLAMPNDVRDVPQNDLWSIVNLGCSCAVVKDGSRTRLV